MKTVLIIASMLGKDGTSRIITYLANGFSNREDVSIRLLFMRTVEKEMLLGLNSNVIVDCLNIKGALLLSAFTVIRSILKIRPDILLVGFHQLLWLSTLSSLFHKFKIKLFLRDTIIPSLFHQDANFIVKKLNKIAYSRYDCIIAQSNDMKSEIINNWGGKAESIVVINNPIDIKMIQSRVGSCPKELKEKKIFTFVSAGRLAHQKGYDIVIKRMAKMMPNLRFKLLILGSGELEGALKKQIEENHLGNHVKLLGYRKNVSDYLYYSDALLLSSRYEGFPNIVLEAQAVGRPVFSNTCLGGINEIVIDGENGLTCDFEDAQAFKNVIEQFLNMKFDSERIKEMTESRYNMSTILDKYALLFIK